MKKVIIALSLCLYGCSAMGQVDYNIIPIPRKLEAQAGVFAVNEKTVIAAPSSFAEVAELLNLHLNRVGAGRNKVVSTASKKASNVVQFVQNDTIAEEGYTLEVTVKQIIVTSKTAKGAFYAVQTLLQLLSTDVFKTTNTDLSSVPHEGMYGVPCCKIEDAPRYAYRGMHLDVARHFSPVSFIKKYIDLLAMHKFNTFHWHLTDDQGWRIEIKKYPKLTEISSKRKETLIGRDRKNPRYDGKEYGGFYTQEDIKEVVAYAQKRFITIIPEIEMPGHAQAVLAAYPELGCNQDKISAVWTSWGVSYDVFCPREETFTFLENVLSEVVELFPSPYIHIGGDECPKEQWKTSRFCQNLMKREGLKDEHELQSYFIRRIDKFVTSKGRKIIGWDEILEGGISPNATIMSWRGEQGGIAAAKENHDVIMTPDRFVYLDYFQSGLKTDSMNVGIYLPLDKVYGYDPAPKELTETQQRRIIGFQGNVWTEYMADTDRIEYMTYPRACALAETAWSPKSAKNFVDFEKRLRVHKKRLDNLKVNYFKDNKKE
jgi:hexosaminidase